jgi:hypothetical protein
VAALENDNDLNNGPLISKFHDSTMLRIMATLAFMVSFDLYLYVTAGIPMPPSRWPSCYSNTSERSRPTRFRTM